MPDSLPSRIPSLPLNEPIAQHHYTMAHSHAANGKGAERTGIRVLDCTVRARLTYAAHSQCRRVRGAKVVEYKVSKEAVVDSEKQLQ